MEEMTASSSALEKGGAVADRSFSRSCENDEAWIERRKREIHALRSEIDDFTSDMDAAIDAVRAEAQGW